MNINALVVSGIAMVVSTLSHSADISLDGEIALWKATSSFDSSSSNGNIAKKNEYDQTYSCFANMQFEHFVPIVPNFSVGFTQHSEETHGIKIGQKMVDAGVYYNIFDLTPVKIGLGGGVKFGDLYHDNGAAKLKYNEAIPFFNGKVKLDILPTNFNIGIDIKAINLPWLDDSELFDGTGGINWVFGKGEIGGKVLVGYKYFYLKQNMNGYGDVVTKINGPYIGIGISFL
jgi:outer membrane protein